MAGFLLMALSFGNSPVSIPLAPSLPLLRLPAVKGPTHHVHLN